MISVTGAISRAVSNQELPAHNQPVELQRTGPCSDMYSNLCTLHSNHTNHMQSQGKCKFFSLKPIDFNYLTTWTMQQRCQCNCISATKIEIKCKNNMRTLLRQGNLTLVKGEITFNYGKKS